jgi:hypothetical protein
VEYVCVPEKQTVRNPSCLKVKLGAFMSRTKEELEGITLLGDKKYQV